MENISKEQARKDIIDALDKYENVIAFGFKTNGEAAMIAATEDEIYDRLGLAIMRFLERIAKEIKEETE